MSDLPSHSGQFKPLVYHQHAHCTLYLMAVYGSIQVVHHSCIGLHVLAYLPTAVGDRAESTGGVEEGQHAKIH